MKIDLSPKPARQVDEIQAIVASELARFADPTLASALRTFLIAPRMELRTWDWSSDHPQLPTWVVAESPRFDYGVIYSESGFGPENPWGLVFSSHTNFGADNCWYSSLESAFSDSRLIEEHQEGRSEA
jgi:hypothetical protein